VISPTQTPLNYTTVQLQETDVQGPSGIPTCKPSNREAQDPRLRPCGHRDWRGKLTLIQAQYWTGGHEPVI